MRNNVLFITSLLFFAIILAEFGFGITREYPLLLSSAFRQNVARGEDAVKPPHPYEVASVDAKAITLVSYRGGTLTIPTYTVVIRNGTLLDLTKGKKVSLEAIPEGTAWLTIVE